MRVFSMVEAAIKGLFGGPRIGNTSLLDFLLTDFAYI